MTDLGSKVALEVGSFTLEGDNRTDDKFRSYHVWVIKRRGEEVEAIRCAKLLAEDRLAELQADAAIPIVLAEVERHLSAVQYDPAPYTALKHRLSTFLQKQA